MPSTQVCSGELVGDSSGVDPLVVQDARRHDHLSSPPLSYQLRDAAPSGAFAASTNPWRSSVVRGMVHHVARALEATAMADRCRAAAKLARSCAEYFAQADRSSDLKQDPGLLAAPHSWRSEEYDAAHSATRRELSSSDRSSTRLITDQRTPNGSRMLA